MDTLSHGLWATAAGKTVTTVFRKRLRIRWMAFWGVFPDLFSFTPAFVWMVWQLVAEGKSFSDIPRPELMPPEVRASIPVFRLTSTLYHLSHSIIIFAAVFLLLWGMRLLKARYAHSAALLPEIPFWEMTGWVFHIILDIPTHSIQFYPTPFLWPFWDIKIDGLSWATPQFLAINYGSLIVVFVALRFAARFRSSRS